MDPLEIGKLLILLGGLAGIHLKLQSAMRSLAGKGELREISPNPLPVRQESRGATMEDVHTVDSRVTRLEARFEKHMAEARETTGELQESITDLRDRMDDKFGTISDDLKELSRAMGRLEGS